MSYKRLTFLAPLMVFALLLLQITPSNAADCSFWINGIRGFEQTWDDSVSVITKYTRVPNTAEGRQMYQSVKPKIDRCMDGYGCANLGSTCKSHWESLKKAIEGNYFTQNYYNNFYDRCTERVIRTVECSKTYFLAGVCDNCKCKNN